MTTTFDLDAFESATTNATLLHLDLMVTDPEVVIELRRREGRQRDEFATRAIRLGVLALRQAEGMIDTDAVKQEGDRILADVRELLVGRTARVAEAIEQLLSKYLAPDGALTTRLDALTGDDGEIASLLSAYVDGEGSALSATLTRTLGENSALMKMLSPTQKGGLTDSISKLVETALKTQNEEIVKQFSLDKKDSALARLIEQVKTSNGKLHGDLSQELKKVTKEFSLDYENSALARLKKEMMEVLVPLTKSNAAFQDEVKRTLDLLNVRKEEASRTTTHGNTFEDAVGAFLREECEKAGDLCEDVGTVPGPLGKKVGDHVVVLGPESAAPEGRVVVEAKARKGVSEKKAFEECRAARENRDADMALFVFDRQYAPEMKMPVRRLGKDILVLWDAEDPATDVYLRAALSMARGLVVMEAAKGNANETNVDEMERLVTDIGRHAEGLQAILRAGRLVKKHNGDVLEQAETMHDALIRQVEALSRQVECLRSTK